MPDMVGSVISSDGSWRRLNNKLDGAVHESRVKPLDRHTILRLNVTTFVTYGYSCNETVNVIGIVVPMSDSEAPDWRYLISMLSAYGSDIGLKEINDGFAGSMVTVFLPQMFCE